MALQFKKGFENQTIVLADGTLIDKASIGSDYVQAKLKNAPWFAYMLEETTTDPPVTGGGGAGDPRPPKKQTTARAKK